MRFRAFAAMLAACSANAQQLPTPGPGDPRLQVVTYDPNQVVRLEVTAGYHLTVMFAPGELIESVAIGDSEAWQAIANKRGDYLFLKPVQEGADTNLTVITDARVYSFELASSSAGFGTAPYAVRFMYPEPIEIPEPQTIAEPLPVGRYAVRGARAIRPSAISDDGERTFIEWPIEATLPAVYALDDSDQEILADGDMIDGRYVLTRVNRRLIFRLDRQTARAERLEDEE